MLGWPFWVCGIRQDRSGGGRSGDEELDKGGQQSPVLPSGLHGPLGGRQGRATSIMSPSRSLHTARGLHTPTPTHSGRDPGKHHCGPGKRRITEATLKAGGSSAHVPRSMDVWGRASPGFCRQCAERVSRGTQSPHRCPQLGWDSSQPLGLSTGQQAWPDGQTGSRELGPGRQLLHRTQHGTESEAGWRPRQDSSLQLCPGAGGAAGRTPQEPQPVRKLCRHVGGKACPQQLARVPGGVPWASWRSTRSPTRPLAPEGTRVSWGYKQMTTDTHPPSEPECETKVWAGLRALEAQGRVRPASSSSQGSWVPGLVAVSPASASVFLTHPGEKPPSR